MKVFDVFKLIYILTFLFSIHKQIPVVATSSGQRHRSEIVDDDDDENDRILLKKPGENEKEDMIKLWWCGPNKNDESGMM